MKHTEHSELKDKVRLLLEKQATGSHYRFRKAKDSIARHAIAIGGVSVIFAVVMIFFYLLYVVFPIFSSASLTPSNHYQFSNEKPLLWGLEEYGEIIFRVKPSSKVQFLEAETGQLISEFDLDFDSPITHVKYANREEGLLGVLSDDGQFQLVKLTYSLSYPNNERKITPGIEYPLGDNRLDMGVEKLKNMSVTKSDELLSIAIVNLNNQVSMWLYELEESFSGDGYELEEIEHYQFSSDIDVDYIFQDAMANNVYIISQNGRLERFARKQEGITRQEMIQTTQGEAKVSYVTQLLGETSLLIGDSDGHISQWFPVRDDNDLFSLKKIRTFSMGTAPIVSIESEIRRKGFFAIDSDAQLGVFFTTSHRTLLTKQLDKTQNESISLVVNPRANRLLISNSTNVTTWVLENEHPELSWSSLWGEVWYESYPEPQYTWQSSASTNDFESKFSLVPLSFGTLKAAFYAMLFAMPLAICGAIFTAYFMAPKMRGIVKPTIEIMEALPTVILGFLAGLWLAPILEDYLPGVFLTLVLMPIAIILFGLFWHHLPKQYRLFVGDGWQAALLVPVVMLIGYFCFSLSYPVEQWFFNGNMRVWLTDHGISYDQRNSLVVGIAMGFAVIPTIFSIAEDAIFSVPRHLTNGSLALGASPWQTLVRVVLPTASPGIFSAVMIGLGRAVGETMIVLMATGNTPIMEANIFEGMRTLSANIAVEMPESEVGSSHYRVLFLAGLVLFMFTFFFNTVAENIRHRLRKKYGSL